MTESVIPADDSPAVAPAVVTDGVSVIVTISVTVVVSGCVVRRSGAAAVEIPAVVTAGFATVVVSSAAVVSM